MWQIPVIAFTASHLNAKQITLSFQKLLCLFLFSVQMHPGRSSAPAEPFHKKARTGFKSSKLAKAACSSLTTSSPWVSLSQPTRYHNLCFITLSTCYCVRPLNGLKYFWALSYEKIQDSLPTRYEAIFVFDPEPPMNLVDLLHPQELMYVLDILHHFYCQTLRDCSSVSWLSGQFCRVERLLKCKLKKACQYLATIFMLLYIFFWVWFYFV